MKLAIIGDLHYPKELIDSEPFMEEARDAFYEHFMDMFLAIDADYHISIGDLVHMGELNEFDFIMRKIESSNLRGQFLHVLGNHDTFTYSKKEILSITRQQRYGVIEEPNAIILLLDTARETREDWSGTIDEEQLTWLELQMKRTTDKPLFVFGHHPLYDTTARSTEPMMSLDPALDVWAILEQWQGTGFYFNGHNHVHSIIQKENWHFIQTASIPDVPAVRIVTVQEDGVRVEMLDLSDTPLTAWASAFNRNMYDYEKYPNAEGNRSDLELMVSPTYREKAGEAL
jgi:Icc protein